ncbi:MAG: PQQ-binding-like beta-propeller repeat protein [Planctomycetota bacterium]
MPRIPFFLPCRVGPILLLLGAVSTAAPAQEWPSFRGPAASGIAVPATGGGQHPPTSWNVSKGTNIRWKTEIPGLAHSSPVVGGSRVFVTTAISEDPEPYLRVGLYGESPDNPEPIVHEFCICCLDTQTGEILWEEVAHSGMPKVKRHIKGTHANSTPATDGRHVVACFGSEGLYGYDVEGNRLWKQDLGYIDSGAFNAREVQWGFGSSPVIHDGLVIVQCDANNRSFIAAFNVATGEPVWRTDRDEYPTWSTPTVHSAAGRTQVILNGFKHIGGYDVKTGRELWRMRGGGDIPVPTPIVAHGLIFITSAHGPMSPIYAIRIQAEGDISLTGDEDSNEFVAWSTPRRGAYIPTPIVYGDYLYVGDDQGTLACYEAKTGKEMYRRRLGAGRSAYSASPVAADGKLYFTSEEGDIRVVKAGPEYESLAVNPMGELCLASPAITGGTIFVRTVKNLYAIGEEEARAPAEGGG